MVIIMKFFSKLSFSKQFITSSSIMGAFGVGIFFIITGDFNANKRDIGWRSYY